MDINNKKLKPIVMAFIILGSIFTLGLKFYLDHSALSVDRPSFIKTSPNNKIAILFGNSIFITDSHGERLNQINFDDIGLKLKGDFDFFSNGDLLVYSNKEEPTLLENLKQYARLKETRTDKPSNDNGFYRCHISSKTCKKFTNNLPAFHSTFRLLIDRLTDTIYIADTPKFALYKVNSDGLILAQNTDGLHFPNQLFLLNGNLHIANTNTNSIKIVHTKTEKFGDEIINHRASIDDENRWPSELIKTPDGWWVSIAGSNMQNARIQMYDDNWKPSKIVNPDTRHTDLWAMAINNGIVYVTDWSNIDIYRFDLTGTQLSNFNNPDLNRVIEQAQNQSDTLELYASFALIGFITVFGLGVLAAFVLEKKETLSLFKGNFPKEDSLDNDASILESPPGKDIYWIETKHRKYRKPSIILMLISISYIAYLILTIALDDSDFEWGFIFSLSSIIPILVFSSWLIYRNLSVKIGISGQLLLIDEGNGNIGVGKESAIQHTNSAIIIGKAVALIGQPDNSFFAKDELEKLIKPRVTRGQKISKLNFYKKLWHLKHPLAFVIIATLAFMPIALLLS